MLSAYVDDHLVGTGKVTKAAIVGKGGGVWAASKGYKVRYLSSPSFRILPLVHLTLPWTVARRALLHRDSLLRHRRIIAYTHTALTRRREIYHQYSLFETE